MVLLKETKNICRLYLETRLMMKVVTVNQNIEVVGLKTNKGKINTEIL